MKREPVSSGAIKSAGYDAKQKIFEVETRQGDVYRYFDVSHEHWQGFQASTSKGAYFNTHIKPHRHARN